ncbi:unnamed protein product [Didymodactylos carnosus]|uniref:Uncharacterized protein n=1 Tax=Didymodactylos carnosus TaxID=1234261 RepID=A0A814C8Z1_9BILA|nr:unnamed protein product [Didymodactylos carnosus]CAF0936851.1 unnamed protein product [Didymodactylos carnosus]CAF3690379.1 unnamed protein product [Didymodactylos carnosus]CAF3713920.1 unnamed protein product [Didymodactylos carnosus]
MQPDRAPVPVDSEPDKNFIYELKSQHHDDDKSSSSENQDYLIDNINQRPFNSFISSNNYEDDEYQRSERAAAFLRFGRPSSSFLRFGRSNPSFLRFGRSNPSFLRFGRVPADKRTYQSSFLRFG